MPYGMKGGDTPAKDAKMERCVTHVMKSGKDKTSAIRICKVAIQRSLSKKR